MADVYGVTPEDVSAEMPGLFPVFTPATKPSRAIVIGWITDADTYINTVVTQVTAINADLTEAATRLARRYVLDDVVLRVTRAIYAGSRASPADIAAMIQGLGGSTMLAQLQALATSEITQQLQALEEATLAGPRLAASIGTATSLPVRDLVINDQDLDGDRGPSGTSEVLDSSTRWHRRPRF